MYKKKMKIEFKNQMSKLTAHGYLESFYKKFLNKKLKN